MIGLMGVIFAISKSSSCLVGSDEGGYIGRTAGSMAEISVVSAQALHGLVFLYVFVGTASISKFGT